MPIGALDRTPPPFFRQGHSALSKLVFFAALSLFMMVADTRFNVTQPLRALLATVLQPVERGLMAPVLMAKGVGDYVGGVNRAVESEASARAKLAAQSALVSRVGPLVEENNRLRALLELRPNLEVQSIAAQVLYEASDPYSRKVILDRGSSHGLITGSPVVNEAGVLGQVTRVYPLSSEVTLLTDKDAAIPVLNTRTQHRGIAFGNGSGTGMELRFMVGNADVNVGDELLTSGVDGVYPPGIPVANVVAVDRRVETGFARITLAPTAVPDDVRHVLVLQPLGLQLPQRPEESDAPTPSGARAGVPRAGAGASAAVGGSAAAGRATGAAAAALRAAATPKTTGSAVATTQAKPAAPSVANRSAASAPRAASAVMAPVRPTAASTPRAASAATAPVRPAATTAPRAASAAAPVRPAATTAPRPASAATATLPRSASAPSATAPRPASSAAPRPTNPRTTP
jgi:rod shape-determining protein MreC